MPPDKIRPALASETENIVWKTCRRPNSRRRPPCLNSVWGDRLDLIDNLTGSNGIACLEYVSGPAPAATASIDVIRLRPLLPFPIQTRVVEVNPHLALVFVRKRPE